MILLSWHYSAVTSSQTAALSESSSQRKELSDYWLLTSDVLDEEQLPGGATGL